MRRITADVANLRSTLGFWTGPAVANVTRLVTLDKGHLTERAGELSRSKLDLVLPGIDVVLGRGRAADMRLL